MAKTKTTKVREEEEVLMLTQSGYDQLVQELSHRKNVLRDEIANEIKLARDLGDLSENQAYADAMEKKEVNEARIESLEYMLSIAKVVSTSQDDKIVTIGHTIEIQKVGGDKKKILQFEVRHWMTNTEENLGSRENLTNTYMTSSANIVGNIFYGSKGYMLKDVAGWQSFLGKERKTGESGKGEGNHYQNFIDAVRANDSGLLTAPIEEGFYSCALIHLANISYKLGRTLNIDVQNFQVLNDSQANSMFTKEYRKPYLFPDKI